MRLGVFFSTFPTLSETFSLGQVRGLARLGLDLFLAANRAPAPGAFHPRDEDLGRATHYLTPVRPWLYFKSAVAVFAASPGRFIHALSLAWRLKDGPRGQRLTNLIHLLGAAVLARLVQAHDVGHLNVHFAFGAAGVAVFWNVLTGRPYSLSIHGSDVLFPQPIQEAKLGRAAFVVSNCRFHVDNLRQRFPSLRNQRFYVVRGGLDLSAPEWSNPTPPSLAGPLKILHVARLAPVKAQDVLLEALGRLRDQGVDFLCRLVGDGPSRGDLEALAGRLGLSGRVEFLGVKYAQEVAELYDWSEVVVLSSRSEGTPMTIMEAMAKGRAVVSPRITALPEMVQDGRSGLLFRPGEADDLAAKLAGLARNRALVLDMGATGRRLAEENFDLDRNVRRLKSIFAAEAPDLGLEKDVAVDWE